MVNSRKKAFSLIEVIFSIALIISMTFPVMALIQNSKRESYLSFQEIQATTLAREAIYAIQTLSDTCSFESVFSTGIVLYQKELKFVSPPVSEILLNSDFPMNSCHFYLSPLPSGFRRSFATRFLDPQGYSRNLSEIFVKIEWQFLSSDYNREIIMSVILNQDSAIPYE